METYAEKLLDDYYADGAKKLHKVVNGVLSKFGGIFQKDFDEFYSLANEVLTNICRTYDGRQNFDAYVYSCLSNKIKTEITRRNRLKRQADRMAESLDKPLADDTTTTLGDIIPSSFNLENDVINKSGISLGKNDEKIEKYLNSLTKQQYQVAQCILRGMKPSEIKASLVLTEKQYETILSGMKEHEKIKYLIRGTNSYKYEEKRDKEKEKVKVMEMENKVVTSTAEKTKSTSYSISSICKKLAKHQIRDNHVLQRKSGQWSNLFKSELISDILQGKALTQIIISEEIVDSIRMLWLIDGLQRCTNIEDFVNNAFAISRNVQIYNITYQTEKKDENGEPIYNKDGFPVFENRVFDIRGKKFSQLPEELREKFTDYQIPVLLNLNCTKKEIAYDIARFNRCRPMNVAQNGWTGLEEGYAEFVDNILKMKFFDIDCKHSNYRSSSEKSGMMRRMIVESVMAINFLDDFNKNFGKMCHYLSENANDSTFIEFYALVEKLEEIADENFASIFDTKNSFIWFAVFDRFIKRFPDNVNRFNDFVDEFLKSLHEKKINGESYDDLDEVSTKDRTIVKKRIDHLEKLLLDFLGEVPETSKVEDIERFVSDCVSVNKEDLHNDIDFYNQALDELLVNTVRDGSKLLNSENRPSLLAMVVYSYKHDVDPDDWMEKYAKENNTYFTDQKKNFEFMKKSLEEFNKGKKELGGAA